MDRMDVTREQVRIASAQVLQLTQLLALKEKDLLELDKVKRQLAEEREMKEAFAVQLEVVGNTLDEKQRSIMQLEHTAKSQAEKLQRLTSDMIEQNENKAQTDTANKEKIDQLKECLTRKDVELKGEKNRIEIIQSNFNNERLAFKEENVRLSQKMKSTILTLNEKLNTATNKLNLKNDELLREKQRTENQDVINKNCIVKIADLESLRIELAAEINQLKLKNTMTNKHEMDHMRANLAQKDSQLSDIRKKNEVIQTALNSEREARRTSMEEKEARFIVVLENAKCALGKKNNDLISEKLKGQRLKLDNEANLERIATLETSRDQLKQEKEKVCKKIICLSSNKAILEAEIDKLKHENKEKLELMETNLARKRAELLEEQKKWSTLSTDLKSAKEKINTLETANTTLKSEFDQFKQKNKKTRNEKLDHMNANLAQKEAEFMEEQKKGLTLSTNLNCAKAEITSLKTANAMLAAEFDQFKQKNIATDKDQVDQLKNCLLKKEAELSVERKKFEKITKTLDTERKANRMSTKAMKSKFLPLVRKATGALKKRNSELLAEKERVLQLDADNSENLEKIARLEANQAKLVADADGDKTKYLTTIRDMEEKLRQESSKLSAAVLKTAENLKTEHETKLKELTEEYEKDLDISKSNLKIESEHLIIREKELDAVKQNSLKLKRRLIEVKRALKTSFDQKNIEIDELKSKIAEDAKSEEHLKQQLEEAEQKTRCLEEEKVSRLTQLQSYLSLWKEKKQKMQEQHDDKLKIIQSHNTDLEKSLDDSTDKLTEMMREIERHRSTISKLEHELASQPNRSMQLCKKRKLEVEYYDEEEWERFEEQESQWKVLRSTSKKQTVDSGNQVCSQDLNATWMKEAQVEEKETEDDKDSDIRWQTLTYESHLRVILLYECDVICPSCVMTGGCAAQCDACTDAIRKLYNKSQVKAEQDKLSDHYGIPAASVVEATKRCFLDVYGFNTV